MEAVKEFQLKIGHHQPLTLNYKFITADEFHAYFRNLLINKQSQPDIFYIDQVYIQDFVRSGFLVPLDVYNTPAVTEKYLDFAIRPAQLNGKLWALPIHSEVGLLYYRKDLLERFGLKEPKTWADVEQIVKTIQKAAPDIYGYVGQFKDYEGLVCNFLEFAWSNNADPFNITERNKKNLAQALQNLVDWVNVKGIIPPVALEMTEGESLEAFSSNKAIFLRHWPSGGLAWFKNNQAGNKIGIMPLPIGPSGTKSYMVTGGWYFVVNSNSAYISDATKALGYMDSPESQMINFETKREIPALKDLYKNKSLQEVFSGYFNYLSSGRFEPRNRPQTAMYSEFSRIVSSTVHAALKKEITVEAAVDRMQRETAKIREAESIQ